MGRLGLFPLNLVLFPNSIFPLHIFEPRYKQLVNECLENNKEFGINLVAQNKLFEVGVSAKIIEILKKYDDGKMDIAVQGDKRYYLKSFSEGEKPFFVGEIDFFEDVKEEFNYELLLECTDLYNEIADKVAMMKLDKIRAENLDHDCPSYIIAQKAGLLADQKQLLIEMTSENARLMYLKRHLTTIKPNLTEAETIKTLIKSDGYFKPGQIKF